MIIGFKKGHCSENEGNESIKPILNSRSYVEILGIMSRFKTSDSEERTGRITSQCPVTSAVSPNILASRQSVHASAAAPPP
ncbi:hypothetical protein EYC80_008333 [Monilinia laxa]|uniref:Uncharacterized protein n=1 Tax=Monilinia laxa TaxID=61186 RepID=A0A5N6JPX9_MONLA|nr:hypothetical protein EYC80_008333 [Monilinia laxa]